jgi:predicted RND superfamily exporter protein
VSRLRSAVAVFVLLAAIPAGWLASRLQVDNRLERWMGRDDGAEASYRDFRETFGSDEFILVAVAGEDLFAAPTLDLLVDLAEQLEAVPGVSRVQGLPVVYRDLFGAEDPEALAEEALATPFYKGLFVSDQGGVLGLLLEVEPGEGPAERRRISAAVDRASQALRHAGLRVEMVGSTVLSAAIDRASLDEGRRAVLIAMVLALFVLAALLRSLRAMAVAAACAGSTVVLTLGLMAVAGRTGNMIAAALPALLGVLALAAIIHVLRRFQDLARSVPPAEALSWTLAETTRPCAVAALTTALGFSSLLLATMAPVRDFGLIAAIGLLISLLVNLTVGPLLILWLRVPPRPPAPSVLRVLSRSVSLPPRLVIGVSGAAVVLALASLPMVRASADPTGFLPEAGPTRTAYAFVAQHLGGFYTLEVMVDLPAEWWRPEVASELDRLGTELGAHPVVARVVSPLDLLRQLHRWRHGLDPEAYRLPATAANAEALLADLDPSGRSALARLATRDGTTVRLSAVVNEMDEGAFLGLAETARRACAALPAGFDGEVTGMVLRLVSAQQALVSTQLATLGLALVVILLAIGIGLGSARLALLAAAPNLLPIVTVFGLMAWLAIPLDAATVMVASIALGIGVDDAVHFLQSFARLRTGASTTAALQRTMTEVGPALVITTVTACAGFLALSASAFVPIRHFGLLAAAALAVALAADLLLVPALISVGTVRSRHELTGVAR